MCIESGFEDRVSVSDGWLQGIPELGNRAAESSTLNCGLEWQCGGDQKNMKG